MESIASDLSTLVRTPLADAHILALGGIGVERRYAAGESLVKPGEPLDTFDYVLEGEVEAVNPVSDKRFGVATLGPGQYFGDTGLLNGGPATMGARAVFVRVGAAPNTDWLSGCVQLDDKGFVLTGAAAGSASSFATSRAGIFAVGDLRSGFVKRVASAVGEGSMVISSL